jgi:Mechanosensitive ion channel
MQLRFIDYRHRRSLIGWRRWNLDLCWCMVMTMAVVGWWQMTCIGAVVEIEDTIIDLDPPTLPETLPPTATVVHEEFQQQKNTDIAENRPPNLPFVQPPTATTTTIQGRALKSPWTKVTPSRGMPAAPRNTKWHPPHPPPPPPPDEQLLPLTLPSQIFTLAGKEQPICRTVLQSMLPKQEQCYKMVRQAVLSMVHLEDITLLILLGWLTLPLGRFIYEWLPSVVPWYNNSKSFHKTIYHEISDHIQQIARIACAVYMVDIVKLAVVACGYTTIVPWIRPKSGAVGHDMPHAFGHIVYTMWIANRIKYIKRILLRRYVNRHPESFGRVNLIQKWIDAILYSATIVMVLHILKVESGVALSNSFLAVGSVGTLAFGLASQGLATQVMNGLLLASSDRIYEGDDVMLGSNGFAGKIVKLGWLETVIRGR